MVSMQDAYAYQDDADVSRGCAATGEIGAIARPGRRLSRGQIIGWTWERQARKGAAVSGSPDAIERASDE